MTDPKEPMEPTGPSADEHYCMAEVDLFRDLSKREMAELGSRAPRRAVPAGQVVFSPTRPSATLFVIKSGRIRLYRITADGRTITTAVLGQGVVFGEMDILGLRMRGTWAEAFEPSDLCLMSRADVERLLFTDQRIALRIAEQLSARVADLEDRLTDVTSKTLLERVATALHRLTRHTPTEPVRLTHQQLATLVGATRERTTSALGELAERRLIQLRRGKILISDHARLAAVGDADQPPATG